ncbi:MAG: hypothetical protein Q9187_007583, partial [Circinaria calcarea]
STSPVPNFTRQRMAPRVAHFCELPGWWPKVFAIDWREMGIYVNTMELVGPVWEKNAVSERVGSLDKPPPPYRVAKEKPGQKCLAGTQRAFDFGRLWKTAMAGRLLFLYLDGRFGDGMGTG